MNDSKSLISNDDLFSDSNANNKNSGCFYFVWQKDAGNYKYKKAYREICYSVKPMAYNTNDVSFNMENIMYGMSSKSAEERFKDYKSLDCYKFYDFSCFHTDIIGNKKYKKYIIDYGNSFDKKFYSPLSCVREFLTKVLGHIEPNTYKTYESFYVLEHTQKDMVFNGMIPKYNTLINKKHLSCSDINDFINEFGHILLLDRQVRQLELKDLFIYSFYKHWLSIHVNDKNAIAEPGVIDMVCDSFKRKLKVDNSVIILNKDGYKNYSKKCNYKSNLVLFIDKLKKDNVICIDNESTVLAYTHEAVPMIVNKQSNLLGFDINDFDILPVINNLKLNKVPTICIMNNSIELLELKQILNNSEINANWVLPQDLYNQSSNNYYDCVIGVPPFGNKNYMQHFNNCVAHTQSNGWGVLVLPSSFLYIKEWLNDKHTNINAISDNSKIEQLFYDNIKKYTRCVCMHKFNRAFNSQYHSPHIMLLYKKSERTADEKISLYSFVKTTKPNKIKKGKNIVPSYPKYSCEFKTYLNDISDLVLGCGNTPGGFELVKQIFDKYDTFVSKYGVDTVGNHIFKKNGNTTIYKNIKKIENKFPYKKCEHLVVLPIRRIIDSHDNSYNPQKYVTTQFFNETTPRNLRNHFIGTYYMFFDNMIDLYVFDKLLNRYVINSELEKMINEYGQYVIGEESVIKRCYKFNSKSKFSTFLSILYNQRRDNDAIRYLPYNIPNGIENDNMLFSKIMLGTNEIEKINNILTSNEYSNQYFKDYYYGDAYDNEPFNAVQVPLINDNDI